jgi:hypothetical protein
MRRTDTKAGRVHYIPLSGPALALLRAIHRTEGNPFILVGRGPRKAPKDGKAPPAHLVNISKNWNRVREAATLSRWREDPPAAALIERLTADRTRDRNKHVPKGYAMLPSVAEIRAAAASEGVELPRRSMMFACMICGGRSDPGSPKPATVCT